MKAEWGLVRRRVIGEAVVAFAWEYGDGIQCRNQRDRIELVLG